MVYEEHPEWKKLLKEKKYKEAAEGLMYEMGVNMMRVSNVYSDKKHDIYKEYKVAFGYYFGRNSNKCIDERAKEYIPISTELGTYNIWLNDFDEDDDIPGDCKYIIKKILKYKKELIKKMKKIEEV